MFFTQAIVSFSFLCKKWFELEKSFLIESIFTSELDTKIVQTKTKLFISMNYIYIWFWLENCQLNINIENQYSWNQHLLKQYSKTEWRINADYQNQAMLMTWGMQTANL